MFARLVPALVFKTSGGFEQSSQWIRFPYTPACVPILVLQSIPGAFPGDEDTPLTLPSQWRRLEALIKSHEARFVVIDPWIAFLDTGLESASDSTIRKVLRALTRMAQRCRCALLLLRHLRKAGGRRAVYRGVGSIGLVAACRSAWLIARSPLDDVCVFAQLKNNLAARQPSLAYEFRGQESGVRGQESEVGNQESEVGNQKSEVGDQKSEVGARGTIENQKSTIENHMPFRWLGPTFWSADELTGGRLTRAGRRAQARAFLQEILRTEAQPIGKVKTAAKDQGIAQRTLSRAVKELKLQLRRVIFPGCHPRNYWLLPGQKLPAVIPDEYVAPAW